MKTKHTLFITARVTKTDLELFDQLRREHFPPIGTFLSAHLTMFHRFSGEHSAKIEQVMLEAADNTTPFDAQVSGPRNLGAGVAFAISCPKLENVRATLAARYAAWLGPPDSQRWQPHITVQNKVSRERADGLHKKLSLSSEPFPIRILGLDLGQYVGGPWKVQIEAQFKI